MVKICVYVVFFDLCGLVKRYMGVIFFFVMVVVKDFIIKVCLIMFLNDFGWYFWFMFWCVNVVLLLLILVFWFRYFFFDRWIEVGVFCVGIFWCLYFIMLCLLILLVDSLFLLSSGMLWFFGLIGIWRLCCELCWEFVLEICFELFSFFFVVLGNVYVRLMFV